jgi:hypothetical protein
MEAFVAPKALRAGRYEVTLLRRTPDFVLALGFAAGDFQVGRHVGWDRKTIGVHSDTAICFREGVAGAPFFDPQAVQEGKTLGMALRDGVVTYSVGQECFTVASEWNVPSTPTITTRKSVMIVVNFGESPFVAGEEHHPAHGVQLFNGVRAVMTNQHLDAFALAPGDVVETRDLAFRGTFAGELGGRLYFTTAGLDGAFPFAESDPLEFRRIAHVIWRERGPLAALVLTSEGVRSVDLARGQRGRIWATRNGIAVLVGLSRAGEYIMRPVIDFFNNCNCFVLTEQPVNVLALIPELLPLQETEKVRLLDIVEDAAGRIAIVLGRTRDAYVVWNNVKIDEVQLGSNILFRFNGYHYKYLATSTSGGQIVNVGTQPGGNAFLANYQGTRGSVFCHTGLMQKSYGAKGFMPIPGVAALLLRTLNEAFLLKLKQLICHPSRREAPEPGLVLRVEDAHPEVPKRPLLTHVKAKPTPFRPSGYN